jgi:XTP/dITP diphosphohydrolase
MKEIVIASKNKGKITEFMKAFAAMNIKVISLAEFTDVPDAVETGKTFQANAVMKAQFYAKYTGLACLADDSGLEVDALGGAPGVYSARYAGVHGDDAANNAKLLAELEKVQVYHANARFRCALAFADTNGELLICDGCCEGTILPKQQGKNGFGYDPLFYIENLKKTLAEITIEEKNKISHRGAALKVMTEKLAVYIK